MKTLQDKHIWQWTKHVTREPKAVYRLERELLWEREKKRSFSENTIWGRILKLINRVRLIIWHIINISKRSFKEICKQTIYLRRFKDFGITIYEHGIILYFTFWVSKLVKFSRFITQLLFYIPYIACCDPNICFLKFFLRVWQVISYCSIILPPFKQHTLFISYHT